MEGGPAVASSYVGSASSSAGAEVDDGGGGVAMTGSRAALDLVVLM